MFYGNMYLVLFPYADALKRQINDTISKNEIMIQALIHLTVLYLGEYCRFSQIISVGSEAFSI